MCLRKEGGRERRAGDTGLSRDQAQRASDDFLQGTHVAFGLMTQLDTE